MSTLDQLHIEHDKEFRSRMRAFNRNKNTCDTYDNHFKRTAARLSGRAYRIYHQIWKRDINLHMKKSPN